MPSLVQPILSEKDDLYLKGRGEDLLTIHFSWYLILVIDTKIIKISLIKL